MVLCSLGKITSLFIAKTERFINPARANIPAVGLGNTYGLWFVCFFLFLSPPLPPDPQPPQHFCEKDWTFFSRGLYPPLPASPTSEKKGGWGVGVGEAPRISMTLRQKRHYFRSIKNSSKARYCVRIKSACCMLTEGVRVIWEGWQGTIFNNNKKQESLENSGEEQKEDIKAVY